MDLIMIGQLCDVDSI